MSPYLHPLEQHERALCSDPPRDGFAVLFTTAQECRGCHTMHFIMANTYGQTVCLECDVAPDGKEAG